MLQQGADILLGRPDSLKVITLHKVCILFNGFHQPPDWIFSLIAIHFLLPALYAKHLIPVHLYVFALAIDDE